MCVRAVPSVNEHVCVKHGEVRLDVGISSGHVFYGRPVETPSIVRASTSLPPTGDFTTIPISSYHDLGGSTRVISGGKGCPWTLVALTGQRIRLRTIVVDPQDDPALAGGESRDLGGRADTCPETLVIRDSVFTSTVRLPVCRGRQRDSQIYHSIGHRLTVHVEQSEVRLERHGKAGEPLNPSPSPTSIGNIGQSGFLLTYECW